LTLSASVSDPDSSAAYISRPTFTLETRAPQFTQTEASERASSIGWAKPWEGQPNYAIAGTISGANGATAVLGRLLLTPSRKQPGSLEARTHRLAAQAARAKVSQLPYVYSGENRT